MKKRASDQLSHPSEVFPVTRTNPQQVFRNIPSDEFQGTSNNPLPAFTIPDSSLQSTAPAVISNFPGKMTRHHNSKQQQISCMSHQGFILKHQFQLTTFFRELELHKECLQLSRNRFRKSSPQLLMETHFYG